MAEFSVTSNETIIVSPEYVGSRLLLKLKEMAEEYLGMPVANAVISVPAEFDLQQRNSTIQAANLAGNSTLNWRAFSQIVLGQASSVNQL